MAQSNSLRTLSVAELLERFPRTAGLLIRYRMACVGCDIAAFHTVAEAAAIYGVDAERFFAELDAQASGQAEPQISWRNQNE
jgi:hybrid cluster-associated redox disulfide protein